jgi:hypothetical protein
MEHPERFLLRALPGNTHTQACSQKKKKALPGKVWILHQAPCVVVFPYLRKGGGANLSGFLSFLIGREERK